jgi:hypothetical protein
MGLLLLVSWMIFLREGKWRGRFLKIGLIHFGFWIADFGLEEVGGVFNSKSAIRNSKYPGGFNTEKTLGTFAPGCRRRRWDRVGFAGIGFTGERYEADLDENDFE